MKAQPAKISKIDSGVIYAKTDNELGDKPAIWDFHDEDVEFVSQYWLALEKWDQAEKARIELPLHPEDYENRNKVRNFGTVKVGDPLLVSREGDYFRVVVNNS